MTTPQTPLTDVELFVDPACPWAWLTSRWMVEVERVRPVRVTTRLFCLAEVNRGREDGRLREAHAAAERALRVLVQARRTAGSSGLADTYTALEEAHQERGEPLGDTDVLASSLAAAGLDRALAERALADDSTRDELLEEHRAAVARGAFGVPTLCVDGGPGFFGPVVDIRIRGEDAGALWDHLAWLLRHGHVFEVKRERTGKAQVGRYLVAQTS